MKILFDARELTLAQPPAGIGRYIQCLYSAIAELDESLHLEAFCHQNQAPFHRYSSKIQAIAVGDKYFGRWSQTLWEAMLWGRMIDSRDADLFHSTAHLAPGRCRTPMVLTVHDLTNFLFPGWYKWTNQVNRSLNLRRGIRQAQKIIAVSQSTADDLVRLFPQAASRTEVVLEGVEPEFHRVESVERAALGLGFPEPFILWVGTTSPRKNLMVLLEAFEKLPARFKEVHLVLVGQRGWKDQSIFEFIQRPGLGRRIHPLGYVPKENLPRLYSECAVFVFPSLYEGFGLPALEAMACGAPVLASGTSSLPEILPEPEALFDPRRPEELAQKLEWLLADEQVQNQLSEAGLKRAKEFTWDKAAGATMEIFKEMIR